MGITSKEQKEYDEAIKWYNKAITLTKDSLSIIKYINNKAVVFIKQGSYKKAITQLHSIKYSSVIKKDTSAYAKVIDNIAHCKSKLNDLNAEKELQEALKLRKKIKDFSGQFASYIHLTEHNQDLKQNEIALHYAKRAYQIAQKINSPTSKLEALSYFIQLEDYRTEIVQEFQSLTSSINDSKQRNEYKFAKVKYDVEDTRKSNLLLKAQNAKSANQKTSSCDTSDTNVGNRNSY